MRIDNLGRILSAIITGLLGIISFTFIRASDDLAKLNFSVQELNKAIEILITKGRYAEEKISDYETRLRLLEGKKNSAN